MPGSYLSKNRKIERPRPVPISIDIDESMIRDQREAGIDDESLIPGIMPSGMLGGVIGRHEMDPGNPDPIDRDLAVEALPGQERRRVVEREAQRRAAARLAREDGEANAITIDDPDAELKRIKDERLLADERAAQAEPSRNRDAERFALSMLAQPRGEDGGEPMAQTVRGLNPPSGAVMPLSEATAGDPSHRAYQNLAQSLPERGTLAGEALSSIPGVGMFSDALRSLGRMTPEGYTHGGAQLLTLGHSDELMARAMNPTDDEGYQRDRDRIRAYGARINERDPAGVMAGGAITSAPMAAIPGGGDLARYLGAGRLATGALIAGEGAAMGGLNASGESESEMFSPEWREDVGRGAKLGGALSGAMYAVPTLGAAAYHGARRLLSDSPEALAHGAASLQEAIGGADEGTVGTVRRFLARRGDDVAAAAPDTAPRLTTGAGVPDAGPYRSNVVEPPASIQPQRSASARPSVEDAIAASEGRVGSLSPRELRAAAMRGADPVNRDRLLADMSDSLNNMFRLGDEVDESVGRLQAKEQTIRAAMEQAPPMTGVRNRAARVAQQVNDSLGEMAAASGGALSRRQREEMQRLVDVAATASDPASSFMALDALKRQIGRLRSVANQGRLGPNSAAFADDLEGVYQQLRGHLEDSRVWGEAAANIQREANAAYTPMIPARAALENRFMEFDPHTRAANGWDQGVRANRQRIGSLLDNANAADRLDERADLLRGARQFSDWAETMQRLYAGDTAAAQQMQTEARRMLSLIEQMQTDARAADMLRRVSESVGSVGVGPLRMDLTKAVRLLQRYADDPVRAAQQPGGRMIAAMMPALSRALRPAEVAVSSPGRSAQPAAPASISDEDFNQMLESLPEGELPLPAEEAAPLDEASIQLPQVVEDPNAQGETLSDEEFNRLMAAEFGE